MSWPAMPWPSLSLWLNSLTVRQAQARRQVGGEKACLRGSTGWTQSVKPCQPCVLQSAQGADTVWPETAISTTAV